MPVQAKNKDQKIKNNSLTNFLGINYSNWNHKNLLFWNFIIVIVSFFSWVFLVISIICFVIGGDEIRQTVLNTSRENPLITTGIVFIILFFISWIVTMILSVQRIVFNAREIDVISDSIWLAYANVPLAFIFSFISYFVWRNIFSENEELKNSDLNENLHYEYEKKEETRQEVDYYRMKKEELLKKELDSRNKKQINTTGKPLTGNKKKKR